MIYKNPKPTYLRLIKKTAAILFVAEALFFAGSYGIYYRMNRDRDFRKYLNENYPTALEGFYKVGEFFDEKAKTRQIDLAVWKSEEDK